MHPVTAIKKRARVTLQTALADLRVFRDRIQSLSEQDNELPAIKIAQASLDPAPDLHTFGTLGAILNLDISFTDQGSDEVELADRINEYWARAHAVLIPRNALGLDYVVEVVPGGAADPDWSNEGTLYTCSLTARFGVLFSFDRNNPSVDDPNPDSID